MDFKTRKKYYNRFKPDRALEPDDPMNVDLDAFGKERVRGVNWTEKFFEEIVLSDKPVCKLFTGLPGSGKTTDLKRLAQRLKNPDMGNLLPVFINAEEVIDLTSPIEVTDIVSSVIYYTSKVLLEAKGIKGEDLEKAMDEGYFQRLWNWLKNTDVNFGKSDLTVPSVGKLVFEMRTRPSLRQKIRKTVASHFYKFIKEAREELILLEDSVKRDLGREGLVIIFDSLEKLRGITDTWHLVLESAEKVFRGNMPYVKLPVNVLYTVPPALSTRIKNISFLPMIKVRDKANCSFRPGVEAARELIRKRVPDDILKALLGDAYETSLEQLILRSGGYPREILQVMQKIIAQTEHPISETVFRHILQEIANEYRNIVLGEMYQWLAKVSMVKDLIIENDNHRRTADQMLQNQAVQRYLNDELWFDLHPAVRDIPGVAKAIAQLEAESENGTKA
jgi:hypothetical protein